MRLCIPLLAGAVLLCASGVARANGDRPKQDANPSDTAGKEVIVVWDERPDKPFDRDTELRLTGEDLQKRGATNLADALDLLPDVYVRSAGRGGLQIDIRAARKGQVKVLIDGAAVTDPYVGNFDLTSIPVTDIVQIRVSTSPASPIDGAGGSGAVIEVHTRDAIGKRMVEARLQGQNVLGFDASATGRLPLAKTLALRLSASGELDAGDFDLAMPYSGTLDEKRRGAGGALRLEYRRGSRRVALDAFAYTRSFRVPPGQNDLIPVVDPETAARLGLSVDDKVGKLRLRGNAYVHYLRKNTERFEDAALSVPRPGASDDVTANRAGAFALANRPFGKHLHVIASTSVDREQAKARDGNDMVSKGDVSIWSAAAGLQVEKGPLRIDAAGGVAVPFGVDAKAWPEAKLMAEYRLAKPLSLRFTGARKGRTPTLRERFDRNIGNPDLGPEQALFGELAVRMRPRDGIGIDVSAFVRDTDNMIRFDLDRGALLNLGNLVVRGFDVRARFTLTHHVRVGGSWVFQDAYSPEIGTNALDFLPHHRGDAWLNARFGDRLGGWLRLRYVGEQIDRNEVLPGRVVLDASAYYRISAKLRVSLRVDNTLGDDYLLRLGVNNPGRVVTLSLYGRLD